ncbi:hypothetical protein CANMA_005379 [Candida margitis]|uniref:uncharacterized protein n=1 Tax=Candida margitis TaxID=1775924 RepID=UPI002225F06D|nr:uncharacterized protein CANMA_005379 [Candida margitis]KAI5950189.1 hypothetical protein CANMA_005379 [Candida margitis]
MVKPQHIRKPEFNERYYICRGTGRYYSNFNITVKYDRVISKSHLSTALRSLILKNSWLTHNFFKVEGTDSRKENFHNWRVQVIDKITFEDVVTYKKIERFDESVLQYLNGLTLDMNVQKPLWRIIAFEESNGDQLLTVYVDHSQYDGLSAVQFQKDLSKELEVVVDDDHIEETLFEYTSDFDHLPLNPIPAAEVVTDLYVPSYGSVLNHYLESYFPLYSKLSSWIYSTRDDNVPLFCNPTPVKRDLTSKYKIMKFDGQKIGEITKFCRSKGVTLTGYFDVFFIKALQETIFKAIDPKNRFKTNSYVAINGRRYYGDDIKEFNYGTMVCGDPIILPPIDDPLRAMRAFHSQLQVDIKSKKGFKTIGMLQYTDLWNFFNNKIGKIGGRPTITISNLGKIADSNDSYHFKDMYFGANAGVMYNFVLNMTTVSSNELTAVIAYLPEFESYSIDGENAIHRFLNLFRFYIENGTK